MTGAVDADRVDTLIGVSGWLDLRLTVSASGAGLRQVRMAGLTWVSVHPDQRRRGVLTAMMRHHLDSLREAGVALSGLHSSEPGIYGRFGYGVAVTTVRANLPRRPHLDVPPDLAQAADRIRTVTVDADDDETAALVWRAHADSAASSLGAVQATPAMVRRWLRDLPRHLLTREPARAIVAWKEGRLAGAAVYHRAATWEGDLPTGTVETPLLEASDPATLLALVRRLTDLDLMSQTRLSGRAPDDPLIWWAGGPRAVGARSVDGLWLRLIDVGAALAERGYATACDVVLDVADPWCPWNQRRWRLTADHDGVAECSPTGDAPDLKLPVAALASAYFGDRSLSALARQGLVHELTPGAVRRASPAFAPATRPVGGITF
jgi:hypothetical protein